MMLSDGTARVESWSTTVLDKHRNLVREDAVVLVEAKVRSFRRGGEDGEDNVVMRIAAEKIHDLASVRARFGRNLRLSMNGAADAKKLKRYSNPIATAACGCRSHIPTQTRGGIRPRRGLEIRPEDTLISELGKWLEPKNVQVVYQ